MKAICFPASVFPFCLFFWLSRLWGTGNKVDAVSRRSLQLLLPEDCHLAATMWVHGNEKPFFEKGFSFFFLSFFFLMLGAIWYMCVAVGWSG